MLVLFVFCSLVFIPFIDVSNALLPSVKENMEEALRQNDEAKSALSERELVEEEIFPFLPDNHRDSGTGKFMSFE